MRGASVAHVVVTRSFAGVERHVCDVANELARRGWDAAVVGGDRTRMRRALVPEVRWLPGGQPLQALASLARIGSRDVCHVHMTLAEGVGLAARRFHRAPVIATRHFAAHRGKTRVGAFGAPHISRRLSRELAVSEFVASRLERRPEAVIHNGVPPSPVLWDVGSRVVLVLQRLEPEKDTLTALRAWAASRLVEEGWSLRVVGEGHECGALERWVRECGVEGVSFSGWVADVSDVLASAGMLVASARAEPFGLAVVEAMMAGVPVVAAAAGGHLETIAQAEGAPLFPAGDHATAAAALRSLADDSTRAAVSASVRALAVAHFSITAHIDALLEQYALA